MTAHRSLHDLDPAAARAALDAHYDVAQNVYKLWASPRSVLRALLSGWDDPSHPAQLHYGWDLERARDLDASIRATTSHAFDALGLPPAGAVVLEPGCGIGGGLTQLAASHPRHRFHGVALVERQMRIARRRAAAFGLGNVTFARADFRALPFPDDAFDGAFAIEALCYCPPPERPALLAELTRVLRPGARLVVLDGYVGREPVDGYERARLQDVLDGWTLPRPGSAEAFAAAGRAAGLTVERVEEVTPHIVAAAGRIRAIGRWVLGPLALAAALPGMNRALAPLGFASAAGASRFGAACRSQSALFRTGLGGYWMHVFRKPGVIR